MASVMKSSNTLLKALGTGSGLSFGAWQMLPGTHLSRVIARAGFDWICIDCEHGNIAGMHNSIPDLIIQLTKRQTTKCMNPSTLLLRAA